MKNIFWTSWPNNAFIGSSDIIIVNVYTVLLPVNPTSTHTPVRAAEAMSEDHCAGDADLCSVQLHRGVVHWWYLYAAAHLLSVCWLGSVQFMRSTVLLRLLALPSSAVSVWHHQHVTYLVDGRTEHHKWFPGGMDTFASIVVIICFAAYTTFIFVSHYIYRHFKNAQQGASGFGNLVPGGANYAAQED